MVNDTDTTNPPFAGHKKVGKSLFHDLEQKLLQFLLPLVPKFVETYHLTYSTILWSFGILVFSYLAKENYNWLWGNSVMILLQYLTDLVDGAIGRLRNTGLVRWGYFMDHFLDYVFLTCLLIGYSFVLAEAEKDLLFFVLATFGAFMVNSFLMFSATNKFQISYFKIGPTELRLIFILVNSALAIFGTTKMGGALPYVLSASFLGLCVLVYKTQDELWKEDMKAKKSGNSQ